MENEICAVFDVQGFQMGNTFYPRELAVIGKRMKLCYEIVSNSVASQNRGKLEFQTNAIHGIPINQVLHSDSKCVIIEEDFESFLKFIASTIVTDSRKYIAVKNQQLCKILKKCSIEYIDLEKELIDFQSCPPLRVFERIGSKNSVFCPLHLSLYKHNFDKDPRCSLRKAQFIWEWLTQIRQTTIAQSVAISLKEVTNVRKSLDENNSSQ